MEAVLKDVEAFLLMKQRELRESILQEIAAEDRTLAGSSYGQLA